MGAAFERRSILCDALRRAVPDIVFPGEAFTDGKVRVIFMNWDYKTKKDWSSGAGLTWASRHLAENPEPILVLGFEKEDYVFRRKEWGILQSRAIRYTRLPADIGKLREDIGCLSDADSVDLVTESTRIRTAEFQEDLRSDLWHGPLSSIRRNMNGILADVVNEELDKAVEKLRLNLERYHSARTSVERIKNKYPCTKEPFRSVLDIEVLMQDL